MALQIVKICQKNKRKMTLEERALNDEIRQWSDNDKYQSGSFFNFFFSFGQQTSSLPLFFKTHVWFHKASSDYHHASGLNHSTRTNQSSLFCFLVNTTDRFNLEVIQSGVQTHQPIHHANAPKIYFSFHNDKR